MKMDKEECKCPICGKDTNTDQKPCEYCENVRGLGVWEDE